jgi:hypothetical protein
LPSAQSLSSVSASDGDRIVVEAGVKYYSTYGGWDPWTAVEWGTSSTGEADLVAGDTSAAAPWIEFSDTFTVDETAYDATTYYLANASAPYAPATLRGTWDSTGSSLDKKLVTSVGSAGSYTDLTISETSATNPYRVLFLRCVSDGLGGATTYTGWARVGLFCNLDMTALACLAFHLYATQGDSDTPRGTLASNVAMTEAQFAANNQSSLKGHVTFSAPLTEVALQSGDRLVLEVGLYFRNTTTSSKSGVVSYGGSDRSVCVDHADPSGANLSWLQLTDAPEVVAATTFPALTVAF